MKRLVMIAVLLGALVLPAQAGAAPTLAQLAKRVKAVEAKLNCLVRYGASEYLGYAYYQANGTVYEPLQDPESQTDSAFALNLQAAFNDTTAPDVWVVAVKNTATCRRKFRTGANPYTARVAAARANHLRLGRVERFR